MRLLRGLLGALLWIVASLVGLLGVIACVTLILLPVGIPLVMLARRLFGKSVRLFLPPGVAHPAQETRKRGRKGGQSAARLGKKARRKVADKTPSVKPDTKRAKKKTRKFLARQRKRVS